MIRHARVLFISAALFNWSVVAGLLLLSDVLTPLLSLEVATGSNLALRDLGLVLVGVFGIAYWRIAFAPRRLRAYIELGILGKSLVVLVIYAHWLAGHISWQLPALALGDVLFATLFVDFMRRYQSDSSLDCTTLVTPHG